MSTHREDQLLNPYWKQRGGTLIRELILRPSRRRADGVIDLDGPTCDHKGSEFWSTPMEEIIAGKNLVCVEVKPASSSLDYAAIGQLLCAIDLLKRYHPASLEGVILAGYDEPYLRDVAEGLGFEVITQSPQESHLGHRPYFDISLTSHGKGQTIAHRKIRSLFDMFGGTLYTDVYISPQAGNQSCIDAIIDPRGENEHINRPQVELLEGSEGTDRCGSGDVGW